MSDDQQARPPQDPQQQLQEKILADYDRLGCERGELAKRDGQWRTLSVERLMSFDIECTE